MYAMHQIREIYKKSDGHVVPTFIFHKKTVTYTFMLSTIKNKRKISHYNFLKLKFRF